MTFTVHLHETTPAQNWRGLRKPEWVDERTRLYTGVAFTRDGVSYSELLAVFDGSKTTLYLTKSGFKLDEVGPSIHEHEGSRAAYRKALSECLARFGEVKFN